MYFQKGHPWIYSILKWKDSAGLGIYLITLIYKYWLGFIKQSHYIILYYQLYMSFINLLHYAAIGVVCGICLLGTLFHLLLCGLAYGRDQLSKRWEIEETIEEMVAGVKTTNVVVCDWETIFWIHITLFVIQSDYVKLSN